MADIETVNRYSAADGRRVEQRVAETQHEAGHKERVVETHVEQVPFALEERVTEKVVPIVTERRKEKFHKGELVDTQLEQVSDESLHLSIAPKVLTKADVEDAIKQALNRMEPPLPKQQMVKKVKTIPVAVVEEEVEEEAVVAPAKPNKLQDMIDMGLYIVLSGELAFIVYQLFIRGMIGQ